MRHVLIFAAVILLIGCVTPLKPIQPQTAVTKNYEIGKKKTVNIGEPIFSVSRAKGYPKYVMAKTFTPPGKVEFWTQGINTNTPFYAFKETNDGDLLIRTDAFPGLYAIRISPQGVVAQKTDSTENGKTSQRVSNGSRGWYVGVGQSNYTVGANSYISQHVTSGTNNPELTDYVKAQAQDTWPEGVLFNKKPELHSVKGAFKAELIYSGKTGNTIKVAYREYANDFARPAFFQEISYDLNESKTIAYKSIKADVVSAINSSISLIVKDDGKLDWLPAE